MDLLVAICILLSIIEGICMLVYIDESSTLITLLLLLILSVSAAIGGGTSILHRPYVCVTVSNKQIGRRFQSSYCFVEPVAVFPVKAYKKHCVFPIELFVVFPDVNVEPSPDQILEIIQRS